MYALNPAAEAREEAAERPRSAANLKSSSEKPLTAASFDLDESSTPMSCAETPVYRLRADLALSLSSLRSSSFPNNSMSCFLPSRGR